MNTESEAMTTQNTQAEPLSADELADLADLSELHLTLSTDGIRPVINRLLITIDALQSRADKAEGELKEAKDSLGGLLEEASNASEVIDEQRRELASITAERDALRAWHPSVEQIARIIAPHASGYTVEYATAIDKAHAILSAWRRK